MEQRKGGGKHWSGTKLPSEPAKKRSLTFVTLMAPLSRACLSLGCVEGNQLITSD